MLDTALMVDASCDLPVELIAQLGIICVPNQVALGEQTILDDRQNRHTHRFFESGFDTGRAPADTIPTPPDAYMQRLREHAMLQCDELLILSPLRELSRTYENAHAGTVNAATSLYEERRKAGRKQVFRVSVSDSRSLFAPHGLMAWEAALKMREGANLEQVKAHIEKIAPFAMGYYAVDNLRYIVSRARDKRDKPSAVMFAIGTLLDVKPVVRRQGMESTSVAKVRGFPACANRVFERVGRLIKEGRLVVPRVVIAYGGDPAKLVQFDEYAKLQDIARERNVSLAVSCMSMTAGTFMGAGAVSVGLAAQPHEF